MALKFSIPVFDENTKFSDLPLWQYLETIGKANLRHKKDLDIVIVYLESLGFVQGVDKVTPDQLRILDYCVKTFFDCSPELGEQTFDDMFTLCKVDGYYVQGKAGRYMPTQALVAALIAAGWIYEVSPETTYFTISTGGRVWAKYQQIIGQRCLFQIKG